MFLPRIAFGLIALLAPSLAAGQWITRTNNIDAEIRQARIQDKLLVVFFSFDERRGERSDTNTPDKQRNQINAVFRDASVQRLVQATCVAVRVDFKQTGKLRDMFRTKITQNDVVVATPELEVVERLDPGKEINVDNVLATLRKGVRHWSDKVYADKWQPILRNEQSPAPQIKQALKFASNCRIDACVSDVVALLGREKLDVAVRTLAFGTLAELGTEEAVRELMRQAEAYRQAEDALRKCGRRALGTLADYLSGEPTVAFRRAYRVIASICKTTPKSNEFWDTASGAERSAEAERMRALALKNAE